MKYDKYENVIASSNFLEYEFISAGPKGNIPKMVHFESTNLPEIYNLAFGNVNKDGYLDDIAVNDNFDRNKILATVAYTVYEFCKRYPNKWVFFSGSTNARTRLYRMAITVNFDELENDFDIFGVLKDLNENFVNVPFQKGIDFFGFLIQKKN